MQDLTPRRFVIALAVALAATPASGQEVERGAPDCSPEAVGKVREAADRGEAWGLYLMARHLSTGRCIPGDGPGALDYYWRAAKLNYPPAFYNLGIISAGTRDFESAELLFFRGAQLGHRGSELELGILYWASPAPVRDPVKAFAWLSVTADRAEPISGEARAFLEEIARKLDPEERGRGSALFSRLKRKFGNVPAFQF